MAPHINLALLHVPNGRSMSWALGELRNLFPSGLHRHLPGSHRGGQSHAAALPHLRLQNQAPAGSRLPGEDKEETPGQHVCPHCAPGDGHWLAGPGSSSPSFPGIPRSTEKASGKCAAGKHRSPRLPAWGGWTDCLLDFPDPFILQNIPREGVSVSAPVGPRLLGPGRLPVRLGHRGPRPAARLPAPRPALAAHGPGRLSAGPRPYFPVLCDAKQNEGGAGLFGGARGDPRQAGPAALCRKGGRGAAGGGGGGKEIQLGPAPHAPPHQVSAQDGGHRAVHGADHRTRAGGRLQQREVAGERPCPRRGPLPAGPPVPAGAAHLPPHPGHPRQGVFQQLLRGVFHQFGAGEVLGGPELGAVGPGRCKPSMEQRRLGDGQASGPGGAAPPSPESRRRPVRPPGGALREPGSGSWRPPARDGLHRPPRGTVCHQGIRGREDSPQRTLCPWAPQRGAKDAQGGTDPSQERLTQTVLCEAGRGPGAAGPSRGRSELLAWIT
ncbi:transmembrane protein 44 isoform 1-T1 [Sarcophilus harrisii]